MESIAQNIILGQLDAQLVEIEEAVRYRRQVQSQRIMPGDIVTIPTHMQIRPTYLKGVPLKVVKRNITRTVVHALTPLNKYGMRPFTIPTDMLERIPAAVTG